MHGLGNDFIIFDNVNDIIIRDPKFIRKISEGDILLWISVLGFLGLYYLFKM